MYWIRTFRRKFENFHHGHVYIMIYVFCVPMTINTGRDSPIVQDVLLQQMFETLVSSKNTPYSTIYWDFLG